MINVSKNVRLELFSKTIDAFLSIVSRDTLLIISVNVFQSVVRIKNSLMEDVNVFMAITWLKDAAKHAPMEPISTTKLLNVLIYVGSTLSFKMENVIVSKTSTSLMANAVNAHQVKSLIPLKDNVSTFVTVHKTFWMVNVFAPTVKYGETMQLDVFNNARSMKNGLTFLTNVFAETDTKKSTVSVHYAH